MMIFFHALSFDAADTPAPYMPPLFHFAATLCRFDICDADDADADAILIFSFFEAF